MAQPLADHSLYARGHDACHDALSRNTRLKTEQRYITKLTIVILVMDLSSSYYITKMVIALLVIDLLSSDYITKTTITLLVIYSKETIHDLYQSFHW
ncbi:MAG: hypothetical protein K0R52_1571 [Alphaproteobacteria bacterium]|jgi:hypothetical protein|nr:hypothetical protein [Alphaproteobacteria bacterium]